MLKPERLCNVEAAMRETTRESYLFRRHRLLASLPELLDCLRVVSQILLTTDQDDGEALAEVKNFRDPL
jgi:hypothetical protein